MVKVYFETPNNSYADLVAIVDSDATYNAILPALIEYAESLNMIVTESVEEDQSILSVIR